jgi:hypothetical protein
MSEYEGKELVEWDRLRDINVLGEKSAPLPFFSHKSCLDGPGIKHELLEWEAGNLLLVTWHSFFGYLTTLLQSYGL